MIIISSSIILTSSISVSMCIVASIRSPDLIPADLRPEPPAGHLLGLNMI